MPPVNNEPKRYYPICLDISRARCVVVGGGHVASRKAASLLEYGALVTIVSPDVTDAIRGWAEDGTIVWREGRYATGDLAGARLVIAATSDRCVNSQVFDDAREAGIPVNAVDDPEHCTFIVPAVLRRGDIQVTVSSGGGAPGVSARIRDTIEQCVGEEWEVLVRTLKHNRDRIRNLSPEAKRGFWRWVKQLGVKEYGKRPGELRELVCAAIGTYESKETPPETEGSA